MSRFSLRISGVLSGADPDRAAAGLARLLRISEPQARAVLRERGWRVGEPLDELKARRIEEALEGIGVACRLEPLAPEPTGANPGDPSQAGPIGNRAPASRSDGRATGRPALDLRVEAATVQCPKCGAEQVPADLCERCGVVMDKYRRAQGSATPAAPRPRASAGRGISRALHRGLTRTLQAVLVLSLGLAVLAWWHKDRLPPPDFYDLSRLVEPEQTPTAATPFEVEAGGIRYLIKPLHDYRLNGVVVSLHDSDALGDVYHRKDWKDFINIRDLCVVWGENAASGVMREIDVHNTTWTCWVAWRDAEIGSRFAMNALSNNHVLSDRPEIQEAIRSAEVGDQIVFEGMLAHYSHAGGFERGTSTTRTDTGNGACETVYVTDFQILRHSNTGWRWAYGVFKYAAIAALLGLCILLVIPERP
jgi:hypothetical protein